MKLFLYVVLGFVTGFAARDVLVALEVPRWGSILVYAPLFVLTLLVSRRIDKATRPTPLFDSIRPPFEDELDAHLRRHDLVLATREQAATAWPLVRVGRSAEIYDRSHAVLCPARYSEAGICARHLGCS